MSSRKLATLLLSLFLAQSSAPFSAAAQTLSPNQQLARDIYKELVEINTVTPTGDTAKAAEAMAARLRAAGFAGTDVQVFNPAPRKGNLVARLHGTGARKPILLMAHLDVVEARQEDWTVNPFKLLEEGGYFYGRGSGDDKFMAATFVANMIRYKQEGYKPDRDIILLLETDEEILDANAVGIQWMLKNHRDLIDAEFALNEGGGVGLKNGKALRNSIQTSEKVSRQLQPGGGQFGRTQLPAKKGQRHLPIGGRPRASFEIRFPGETERDDARLARTGGATRRPSPRRGHEFRGLRAVRSRRCRSPVRRACVQRAAAHHVCRDDARGWARLQRFAAKRPGHGQLPRPAGRTHRRSSEDSSPSRGRRSDYRHSHVDARLQQTVAPHP